MYATYMPALMCYLYIIHGDKYTRLGLFTLTPFIICPYKDGIVNLNFELLPN